jgi:hypothetical protein
MNPFESELKTPEDLRQTLKDCFGLTFPERACCDGHVAPFDALVQAYFGRGQDGASTPIIVLHATRGSGKTVLLAALASLELLGGFNGIVLGGSGEQSRRVHEAMSLAWRHEIQVAEGVTTTMADLRLEGEPGSWRTKMKEGNWVRALTASQRSARGPHPHRLRLDEVDEMDLRILDAAMGQTLTTDSLLPAQTVIASTHQHESGTMTEILKRASERGWPVMRWCWREVVYNKDNPGSWLPASEIERKRTEVSDSMWRVEYELETPVEGGSVFTETMLANLFMGVTIRDRLGEYYELEPPDKKGRYVTSADWARKRDLTVIATIRYDCSPARLVAFERRYREPWPRLIQAFNDRLVRYPGKGIHDATGLGDVVASALVGLDITDYIMAGSNRSRMFIDYETCVDKSELQLPRFESLVASHKYVLKNDLYGTGHPPDEIVALALGWQICNGHVGAKKRGGVPGPIIRF